MSSNSGGSCGRGAISELIDAAAALQEFCQEQAWRFCFIGGLAVQRWGEPRLTVDVDLTLLAGFGSESTFVDALLQRFPARISDARAFALEYRVLLLRSQAGVGLDIALGGLPFEEAAVERASWFTYPPGVPLRTCSAEDLIVMKAFAGRGQDWVDVERVIVRQAGALNWDYIHQQLAPLAEIKGAPGLMDELARRRREFEA